ncbi:MAG: hypothetical protein J1F04_08910 [Oscillospiraceae bacterium]|nr:hypothetical protein [Oscillospiraceae bacterium]
MKSHISKRNFSLPSGLTEETLRNERNFLNYVRMLRIFAKKYCVIIAANNTPCGSIYTQAISKEVMGIGLNIDLYNKFQCPYAAIIDEGVLLYEMLEPNTKNVLEINKNLDTNDEINIISAGYNALDANKGIIKINGTNYSPNSRGLNFVVYDKFAKTVIDAVAFDTYSTLFANRKTDNYKLLDNFIKTHPGVTVVEYNIPRFPTSNLTENEKFINNNNLFLGAVIKNLKKHLFAINRYYDDETAAEVLATPKSYLDNTGARRFEDNQGKNVNIIGGHRVTCHQPTHNDSNLYIYGGCCTFGVGASDEHTIASHLQKIVNESVPEYKIKVHNYGYFLEDLEGMTFEQTAATLNALPAKPGDIVLFNSSDFSGHQIPNIDISKAACEPRNYEVFFDTVHYTPDGYKLIAEKLYEGLAEQGILDKAHELAAERGNERSTASVSDFDQNTNEQLAQYKKFLTDFYNSSLKQTIGAVVMNCNPFTLGHRYLIDKALEQCSFLILFLVEEDKSEFSFDERLKLVDEGTKDIPNLAIIPSGKFVLSSLTFSEYFNKAEMQDRVIDTSLDVNVFAREIAPCLNITKRFAGEEPLDNVTKQYNETMRRVLPEYGIEFVEIPRVELDSKPISASRVRELAKSKNFSELRKLVPQTTLDYLAHKYNS